MVAPGPHLGYTAASFASHSMALNRSSYSSFVILPLVN